MWSVLLFQALDGLRIRSGGVVRPWREWESNGLSYAPCMFISVGREAAMRHPGPKAIDLGVWGRAPGLQNALNTPTGVPYGKIFRAERDWAEP